MVLAIIFFILSLITGYSLLRLLPIAWYKAEAAAATVAIGFLVSTWVAFLACWITGYTVGPWLTIIILAALTATTWYYQPSPIFSFQTLSRKETTAWLLVTIISGVVLGELFVTHMLFQKGGIYYSGGSTWGDLALHLSLITRFANETHFTWDLPIMYGAKLSYPFLLDFLSGMLYRWGASLQIAVLVPGLLLGLSVVQLLFFTVFRLFKNALAASFTPLLFLVNGGIAALAYFWRDWQASGTSLGAFLSSLTKNYTNMWDDSLFFSNLVVDYLLPQRGILMGLTLFLLITTLLWHAWHEEAKKNKLLVGVALLGGLLPFAHAHTFFVVLGLLGYLTVVQFMANKSRATPYLVCLLCMATLAIPQITWQISSNFTDSFSRFQFGWMKPAEENIISFWLRNWGLALPFAFLNIWTVWRLRRQNNFYLHWYIPLLLLWFITNLYIFQPFVYDNMKFMVYAYLAVMVVTSVTLATWFTKNGWGKTLAIACLILLITPGILALVRESYTLWGFADAEERQIAQQFAAIVPSEARVLTSDQHNHFVPALTGRRIMMGYRGWLWTYGLNYQSVEQVTSAIYTGSQEAQALIRQYGIEYVVIGPSEKDQYDVNEEFFATLFPLVLETERHQVYDVRTLRQ